MNKADNARSLPDVEIMHEGDKIILRKVVDVAKFRRIAADVRAHFPAPAKGESILRELHDSRLRGGVER